MKRPQAYGNKVITRYSDTTSMVLRNYLDISDQRLSKVRAGSHLPEVLQTEATPPLKKSKVAEKPDYRSASPLDRAVSHRSETEASPKQIPLSKFMQSYLSQRNIDEGVLSTKETNIYDFFKEKYGLMGKYLGEDILKDGLLPKSPTNEGHHQQEKAKKKQNIEAEIRDQYLLSLVNGSPDQKDERSTKAKKINKEIMEQILREECEEEIEALNQLQTQQNMQVFNGLQEIGFKDNDKGMGSTIQVKTPPSKLILKGNFLRTFVELGNSSPVPTNETLQSTNKSLRKAATLFAGRPQTDYLVFRTTQKHHNILPNIPRITSKIGSHKFGENPASDDTHIDNSYAMPGDACLIEQDMEIMKAQNKSNLTFEMMHSPQESPKKRVNTDAPPTRATSPTGDQTAINDEIQFLKSQRGGVIDNLSAVVKRVREPVQYYKPPPQNGPLSIPLHQIEDSTSGQSKGLQLFPSTNGGNETKNAEKNTSQGFLKKYSGSKSKLKGITLFNEIKTHLPSVDSPKKKLMIQISSKFEGSPTNKFSAQVPALKSHLGFKKDMKNFYSRASNSKRSHEDSSTRLESEKKPSFVTKLVSVKKEDIQASYVNGLFFTSSQLPVSNTSDIRSNTKSSAANDTNNSTLTKNNFGNKYWKSTFHD